MSKKEKSKKDKTETKIKKTLKVTLTTDELLSYGAEQSRAVCQLNSVEKELGEIKESFKSKIAGLELIIGRNSQLIDQGYEYRETDCNVMFDWVLGTKEIFRLDTGEMVESSKIQTWERQEELPEVMEGI